MTGASTSEASKVGMVVLFMLAFGKGQNMDFEWHYVRPGRDADHSPPSSAEVENE
jgi:hypothetical protein